MGLLALQILATPAASAQVSAVTLSGYVRPAARLEADQPASSDGKVMATVRQTGPNVVLIEVTVVGSVQGARVTVPLRMRTNADRFALRAAYRGPATEGSISVDRPQASGSGLLVAPGAVAGFQAQPTDFADEMILASGTRISARGAFSSPDNALLSTMEIFLGPNTSGTPQKYSFQLTLQNQ